MKDLKDHLDKPCNLIPIKQNTPYEIVNELNMMNGKIKELQDVVKLQTEQVKDLKADSLKKDEQIVKLIEDIQKFKRETNQTIFDLKKQQNNFEYELLKTNQAIIELTNSIYELRTIKFNKQLEQYQTNFNEFKPKLETKVEDQTTNIQKLQLQIKTQIEQEQKNEQKEQEKYMTELKYNKNCQHMASILASFNLRNG
ncbi:hypothetical protein RFI_38617, partial [Reticulomyxa filosa]